MISTTSLCFMVQVKMKKCLQDGDWTKNFLLDSVIYDDFSAIEYDITVNYTDVINLVL